VLALAAVLLAALALLAGLQRAPNPSGDSARYIGLADALREDGRYAFNFRPHTRFPPGFPLLLAGQRALLGESYAVALGAVAVQSALALAAGYLLLRSAGRPDVGLLSIVLLATSPYYFERATRAVAPEAAYVLASFGALGLLAALARGSRTSRAGSALALALCVVAAIALRSVGLALLAPLAAALAFPKLRRRFGPAGAALWPALVGGAGAQLAWALWQRAHRAELWPGEFMHSYAMQVWLRDPHQPELGTATLLDWLERGFGNAARQTAAFSELALHLPWVEARWLSPFVVLPLALGALGLARRLRGPAPLLEVYALAYGALVLAWPFDEGPRFVLAIFPLALLYVVEGGSALAARAAREPRGARRAAAAASAALFLAAVAAVAFEAGPTSRQTVAALATWGAAAAVLVLPLEWLSRGGALVPAALATALAVVVTAGGLQIAPLARQNVSGSPAALRHPETLDAAAWLGQHARADEVVLAGQEAVVHYLTGARTIPFPVSSDPELLRGVLAAYRVRYWIVLEHEPFPYFLPVERERFERFEAAFPGVTRLAHRGPGYRIVAVDPERARTATR
jgi:hypothetical protein